MRCMSPVYAPPDALSTRPAVLLHAELDNAGALLSLDEAGVLARWERFCQRAQKPAQRHGAESVARFSTAWQLRLDDTRSALSLAWALHTQLRLASHGLPPDQRLHLRVGLHAADGDTPWSPTGAAPPVSLQVARLADLAQADETLVSAPFRDRLTEELDATVQDLGDCLLKHESVPFRAYRVSPPTTPSPQDFTAPAVSADAAQPTLAVVPLRARGNDDAFFAVGDLVADRVIDQLGRSRHVRVISRLTGAAFRAPQHAASVIRSHLHARYVLTGSYRVVGASLQGLLAVRIELTDTDRGEVIWRLEQRGSVGELLSKHSELVHAIASGTHHAVLAATVRALEQQPIASLDHYTLMLGGITLMHRSTPDAFETSRRALEALIERAPHLHAASAWLAKWYVLRVTRGLTTQPATDADVALRHARVAQAAPDSRSLGLAMEGFVHLHLEKDFAQALRQIERACHHNPSEPLAWLFGGVAHSFLDQAQPAQLASQRALALSPLDPLLYYFESLAASSAIVARRYDDAINLCQRSLRRNVMHLHTHRALVTACWAADRPRQARTAAQHLLRLAPGYSVSAFRRTAASADTAFGQLMAEALLASGVPPG